MQGRGARRFLDWPRMPVMVALLTDTSFASLALFRSSLGLFLLQATMWGMRREEGFEPAVQELSAHLPAAPRAESPICSGINPEGLLSGEVRAAGGGVAQPELPVPPGGGLTPECREGAGG